MTGVVDGGDRHHPGRCNAHGAGTSRSKALRISVAQVQSEGPRGAFSLGLSPSRVWADLWGTLGVTIGDDVFPPTRMRSKE